MGAYAVLGATSWGVTLAWLLAGHGHAVTLLTRTEDEAAAVARTRGLPRLPEVRLPAAVQVVAAAASPPVDGLIAAVPAQHLRESLAGVPALRATPLLVAAKGIETGTRARMSEVAVAVGWSPGAVAVLSGPNLAHEVGRGLPAAGVVAAHDAALAAAWQRALSGGAFRLYRSGDVVGVELAGATKNVIAVAAGAAAGLGFGVNTIAALVTRGLAEMTRLGTRMGARPETYLGLAGVGDLTATCFSPESRNRRLGERLARGESAARALAAIGEVVEGAATAPVVAELAAARDVEMPITAAVCDVLAGRLSVPDAMAGLLARDLVPETAIPQD